MRGDGLPLACVSAAIETERLILEPLNPAHAPLLIERLQDLRIYQFQAARPPPSLAFLTRRYELLARGSPNRWQTWLNWAVLRREKRQYVGLVQVTVSGPTAAIGYNFFPEFWGHGFAREACEHMMATVARDCSVRVFEAVVDVENERSIKLLEALRMVRQTTGPSADMPGHLDHRYVLELDAAPP